MSIAQGQAQGRARAASTPRAISGLLSTLAADDPVANAMRASARRMIGVAVFSGVINILMLSGSLYMLQVYDRVIPSRNLATLFGLSLMVLIAYLVQGYFDAMRSRMLCRIATLFDGALQGSIHSALATLPLRGVKPVLMQQPLRDLDQVRTFMSGMGPTAFLDMPWIPVFLIGLFLFHPMIGFTALLGTAAIIAMTLVTERISRGATKAAMDLNAQRQVLADATQRNAEIVRALGMTDRLDGALVAGQRAVPAGKHPRDRRLRQSRLEREGAALHPAIGNAGHGRLSRRRRQGVGRHHDRVLDPDGARARARRNRARHLEATVRRPPGPRAPARHLQGDRAASGAAGHAAASLPRIVRAESRGGRAGLRHADRVRCHVFAQGRLGAGAARRERVGQDLALEGAGWNLAGASRRRAARRRGARSMAQRGSRPAHRLSAAGCRPVRRHRGGEHLPFRRKREFGCHPEGRADRRCPRHHPAPAGRLCDANRAGRHVAVGGPEAAGWPGAGGVRRPVPARAR